MQRYFGKLINNEIVITNDDIFHISKVMRMRVNDNIEVDANDKVLLCKITSFQPFKVELVAEQKEDHELNNKVILLASVIKGEKMDLVIQKATELGVDEIILVNTSRCVAKVEKDNANKLERFNKIIKEASEQSKRTKLPLLNKIINFNELSDVTADHKLIAYEESSGSTISFIKALESVKGNESIAILIGPEGGFDTKEVELAEKLSYQRISLGKRILRAETASLYALSVIGCFLESK